MKKQWPDKTVRKYCGFIGNVFVLKVTGLHRAVILYKQKTRKTPSTKACPSVSIFLPLMPFEIQCVEGTRLDALS